MMIVRNLILTFVFLNFPILRCSLADEPRFLSESTFLEGLLFRFEEPTPDKFRKNGIGVLSLDVVLRNAESCLPRVKSVLVSFRNAFHMINEDDPKDLTFELAKVSLEREYGNWYYHVTWHIGENGVTPPYPDCFEVVLTREGQILEPKLFFKNDIAVAYSKEPVDTLKKSRRSIVPVPLSDAKSSFWTSECTFKKCRVGNTDEIKDRVTRLFLEWQIELDPTKYVAVIQRRILPQESLKYGDSGTPTDLIRLIDAEGRERNLLLPKSDVSASFKERTTMIDDLREFLTCH